MAENSFDYLFKIIVVGETGVGKSNLLSQYVQGRVAENYIPTIGVEFASRIVQLPNGRAAKAQIWDTSGNPKYKAISAAHYRRAVGAMLVYDVTKEETFENLTTWVDEIRELAESNVTIMIVGNKLDLCDDYNKARQVPIETGSIFAQAHDLLFCETSALANLQVTEAYEQMINELLKKTQISAENEESKNQLL